MDGPGREGDNYWMDGQDRTGQIGFGWKPPLVAVMNY